MNFVQIANTTTLTCDTVVAELEPQSSGRRLSEGSSSSTCELSTPEIEAPTSVTNVDDYDRFDIEFESDITDQPDTIVPLTLTTVNARRRLFGNRRWVGATNVTISK